MIDMNALTISLARKVLNNGNLHLGSFTLEEFLMQELSINEQTLDQLKQFLGETA